MKYFSFFSAILFVTMMSVTSAAAVDKQTDSNTTVLAANEAESSAIITIKDTSGLSDDAVRELAEEADKAESKAIIEEQGKEEKVFIPLMPAAEKKKTVWENLSPTPVKYDWIELTSGEWLKGEFRAMYNKKLEFDSDELNLLTIDFEDVRQIRTHRIVTVSIFIPDAEKDNLFDFDSQAIQMTGILRLNRDKMVIIQGSGQLEFQRDQIITIAYGGEDKLKYWTGKINFGLDIREGNTQKFDYTTMANVQRRTAKTRMTLDYLGSISSTNDEETANSHRINAGYDVFVTRQFYYKPIFAEYYRDTYQNIYNQYTVGVGVGYTLVDTKRVDWDMSIGPALLYTEYDTVEAGKDSSSRTGALEITTSYDVEITRRVDFVFDYKLTYSREDTGGYKHHMVTTLENEITSWLDIDLTLIWDYTHHPQPNEDKTVPEQSDLQLVVSVGVDF